MSLFRNNEALKIGQFFYFFKVINWGGGHVNNSYTVLHTKYRGKHCCVFECNFAFLLLLAILAGVGSKLKKANPM